MDKKTDKDYSTNLKILDTERRQLEIECSTIIHELTSSPGPGIKPIGIDTPLIDAEGYPRADIDLYHATDLRKRLGRLQVDHKTIMGRIERGLVSFGRCTSSNNDKARLIKKPKPKFDPVSKKWVVRNSDGSVAGVENGHLRSFDQIGSSSEHSITADVSSSSWINGMKTQRQEEEEREKQLRPFVIINEVSPESPAEKAGLRVGDLILQFGTVDHTNHRDLKAIADMVPEASLECKHIHIVALRYKDKKLDLDKIGSADMHDRDKWTTIRMKFYPKLWAGRGLLGCLLGKIKIHN